MGYSFFLVLLLSEIPLLQALESQTQDTLTTWQRSFTFPTQKPFPVKDIVLVEVKETDLISPQGEQARYAALVEHLLQNGAAVVVLNLLDNWTTEILEDTNLPLQTVVRQYSDQVVLVTPITPSNQANIPEISTYHHLLPPLVGDQIQSAYDVTKIQGFIEFDNEGNRLESAARSVHLQSTFYYNNPMFGQTLGVFKSAPLLAFEKFQRQGHRHNRHAVNLDRVKHWPIKIYFWGKTATFARFEFEQVCGSQANGRCARQLNADIARQIRNKIIIIGFTAPADNPKVVLPIQSPFGDPMPGLEVQANILASLMTSKIYQRPPKWLLQILIVSGAMVISYCVDLRFSTALLNKRQFIPFLILLTVGLYSALAVLLLWQNLFLPMVLPLSTWALTGMILWGHLLYSAQQRLISQQRYEIAQLKSAESGAVILQTRKLLQQIASSIHEGPLQELRLVMDKLELGSNPEPEVVVHCLSGIGQTIRHYLQNIRSLTDQLEVTPELRQGLAAGISRYLERLTQAGKLTLPVTQAMQPLTEPIFDSRWIDAREDIFAFFKEAIANIIAHAQPPHGNATQVTVHLTVVDTTCTLRIENDGTPIPTAGSSGPPRLHRGGGYGTKMMETIARNLPNGQWQKKVLETGGYQVELSWTPPSDIPLDTALDDPLDIS